MLGRENAPPGLKHLVGVRIDNSQGLLRLEMVSFWEANWHNSHTVGGLAEPERMSRSSVGRGTPRRRSHVNKTLGM